jgi:outer membrane protein TolC
MNHFLSPYARRCALALPLLLAGCATFSTDGGFTPVQEAAQQHLNKEVLWQRSEADQTSATERVNDLLGSPLTEESAVQIALLNNRGLQATFFELGISESELVQAGRLPNPGFSFSRTHQGGESQISRSIVANIAKLIFMPATRQIEQRRFEQTKRAVTLQMLSLASETRKAYYEAVAADQTVHYMQQVKQAADAGAELAERMLKAGNFNKLEQAREKSFYAESQLNLARAEQRQTRARENLTRLLGLAKTSYTLPDRLPDLPKTAEGLNNLEQQAMTQRLDIQETVLNTEQLAKNLGLSKTTRFINVLDIGAVHNTFNDQPNENGYEVSLELPLFDWGDAKVAKAEAIYMQAIHRAEQVAINARSEVREAYATYRANFDIAKHYYDEIVPLKKRVSQENLLRYNGMLIGVFDLLADARSQIASVNDAIEASRDFWLAKADLDMSLLGRP